MVGADVPVSASGGATTSHSIMVPALRALIEAVHAEATFEDYRAAAVEENVLGKSTEASRRRTFRYLRELYLLRPDAVEFRALRDLWSDDKSAQQLLAGLCALANDAVFHASADAILTATVGEAVSSQELATAVAKHYPDSYSDSTLAKIGRNTSSSWEQTGHLQHQGRGPKLRIRAQALPSSVAYALFLGHLRGARGQALLETTWAKVLDLPRSQLVDVAVAASQRGLLEFKQAGGIIDVGFRLLLRPIEGRLL
jgi:hypothetical protein